MITVLDWVLAGGKCKSASGWEFNLCYTDKDNPYPICGYIIGHNGHKTMYKWDENGYPSNLPTTHGLHLIPVVPITTYHYIDTKKLKEFDKVRDLVKNEIKRLS